MEKNKQLERIIFWILLLIILVLNISSSLYENVAIDEIVFVSDGYLLLKTGNSFITNHPIFLRVISGFPLLFLNPTLPDTAEEHLLTNAIFDFAADFLYKSGNNADLIVFLSRLPFMFLSVLVGAFVFIWAKQLFNYKAGLFALTLYAFSPTIIANSKFSQNDFGVTAFVFITMYFLWRFTKEKTILNAFLVGITLSMAVTSKFTSLILVPIIGLFLLFSKPFDIKKTITFGLIIFITPFLFINILYGFEGSFYSLDKNLRDDPALFIDKSVYNPEALSKLLPSPLQGLGVWGMKNVPLMIPYHYFKDFGTAILQDKAKTSRGGFFLGNYYEEGGHFYYPLIFLMKTPISLILLLIISIFLIFKLKIKFKDELFLLIVPVVLMLYFSYNLTWGGLKYILPSYPFLFVFVSFMIVLKIKSLKYLTVVLLVFFVISSLVAFPYYTSYFNEIIGSSNANKYSSGADIDVGQNLIGLVKYLEKENIQDFKLAYFGKAIPEYYGLKPTYLATFATNNPDEKEVCTPQTGVIAISTTYLHTSTFLKNRDCFEWLRSYTPVKLIGNSIFVFNIQ